VCRLRRRRRRGRRDGDRRGSRQLAHECRRVLLWRQLGREHLDLAPALARGPSEHLAVVVLSQVPAEQTDHSQAQVTGGQAIEDLGEFPERAHGGDPITGRIFGEAEGLPAVGEERGIPLGRQDRRANVEGGQMDDQLDGGFAFGGGERHETREKVLVRQPVSENESVRIHELCVSRCFRVLSRRPGRRRSDATKRALRGTGFSTTSHPQLAERLARMCSSAVAS
jgi:hypothetical protein